MQEPSEEQTSILGEYLESIETENALDLRRQAEGIEALWELSDRISAFDTRTAWVLQKKCYWKHGSRGRCTDCSGWKRAPGAGTIEAFCEFRRAAASYGRIHYQIYDQAAKEGRTGALTASGDNESLCEVGDSLGGVLWNRRTWQEAMIRKDVTT